MPLLNLLAEVLCLAGAIWRVVSISGQGMTPARAFACLNTSENSRDHQKTLLNGNNKLRKRYLKSRGIKSPVKHP
jgi:hypothetical protein